MWIGLGNLKGTARLLVILVQRTYTIFQQIPDILPFKGRNDHPKSPISTPKSPTRKHHPTLMHGAIIVQFWIALRYFSNQSRNKMGSKNLSDQDFATFGRPHIGWLINERTTLNEHVVESHVCLTTIYVDDILYLTKMPSLSNRSSWFLSYPTNVDMLQDCSRHANLRH